MKFKLNWSVCRVCLKEGEELSTIFAKDENDFLIADKIMECGGITITRDSALPHEICNKCSAFLSIAYKFRTTCKNSDEVLRSYVEKRVESDFEDIKEDELIKTDESSAPVPPNAEEEIIYQGHEEPETVFISDDADFLDTDDFVDEDIGGEDNDNDNDTDMMYEPPEHTPDMKPQIMEYEAHTVKIEKIDIHEEISPPKRGRPKKTDPPREKKPRIDKGKPRGPRKAKEQSKTLAMDLDGNPIIKFRDEKPLHICDVCGNVYKMRYSLDNHMRWHRKEKPYDCEICGACFGLNSQLTRHMRTHTGQKPYECQYCGRRFSDLGTKNKHERTHTGERPYTCETCGKTFTYSHVLSAHRLTHTGEKRYSCDECGKRFTRAHHLKAHLSTLIHQKPSAEKLAAPSSSQTATSLPFLPFPSSAMPMTSSAMPLTSAAMPLTSTAMSLASTALPLSSAALSLSSVTLPVPSVATAVATMTTAVSTMTTPTINSSPTTIVISEQPDIKVQILPGHILSNSNDGNSSNPINHPPNMDRAQPMPLFLF